MKKSGKLKRFCCNFLKRKGVSIHKFAHFYNKKIEKKCKETL